MLGDLQPATNADEDKSTENSPEQVDRVQVSLMFIVELICVSYTLYFCHALSAEYVPGPKLYFVKEWLWSGFFICQPHRMVHGLRPNVKMDVDRDTILDYFRRISVNRDLSFLHGILSRVGLSLINQRQLDNGL